MSMEDTHVGVVDAAARAVLTPEAVAPPPQGEALRELRLALVCYGGVSLAIYMHGITKEIHKVVQASAAYERDQTTNPFEAHDSAHHYWNVLDAQHTATHVRTRVVVDIVSGTSAGGINGVFLAAAIARNRSQDPLRRIWLEEGDIKKLLAGPKWLPALVKAPLFLYRSMVHPISNKPPLRGDTMCQLLNQAFDEMERTDRGPLGDRESLIPEQQRLQLFVPITDYFGYDVQFPLDDPTWVRDRTHRHVMRFVDDGRGMTQLGRDWNDALAFSARATSSFPGAFPPLSIDDYERDVKGRHLAEDVQRVLFPGHFLAGTTPRTAHFIDGGVLDNKPFGTTLDAIKLRPASTEVDRRLLYIEPDPGVDDGSKPDGKAPAWISTILAGYAGIPRQEPILDDLQALMWNNGNVDRVRDIITSSFDEVRRIVVDDATAVAEGARQTVRADDVTTWREQFTKRAADGAGFAYPTYLRLRMRAVVDDFAALISDRRCYPRLSSHAWYVRSVLGEWARQEGLLDQRATVSDQQAAALAELDLMYEDRHIRFLVAAVSWWYRDLETDARVPRRPELDAAKHRLYRRLDELQGLAVRLTEAPGLVALVDSVVSQELIDGAMKEGRSPVDLVRDHRTTINELYARVRAGLGSQLEALRTGLDADVAEITAGWSAWARQELLVRHLAFRHWDILVFPVEALSGVNERDHVEVMRISPHEARTIYDDPEKKRLEGVKLGHFGAFFSREGRENDYLWGRLDGADRLVALLATVAGRGVESAAVVDSTPVFDAILDDEAGVLTHIRDRMQDLRTHIAGLS